MFDNRMNVERDFMETVAEDVISCFDELACPAAPEAITWTTELHGRKIQITVSSAS